MLGGLPLDGLAVRLGAACLDLNGVEHVAPLADHVEAWLLEDGDGEVEAFNAFNEARDNFQIVFDECHTLWQKITSGRVAQGPGKSWRSAWAKLRAMMKAAFHDIAGGQKQCLTEEQRQELATEVRFLYRKIKWDASVVPSERKRELCRKGAWSHWVQCMLQKQKTEFLNHLYALTQAVADVACWTQMLDDLLMRDDLSEDARHAQVNLLETELDNGWSAIWEVTRAAETFATQPARY